MVKKGQNARLAAKLTGYKIDIKPESEVEFVDEDDSQDEGAVVEGFEEETTEAVEGFEDQATDSAVDSEEQPQE